jgi:mRNA-degrading endonuclease toxin of MazEF toxin-antitoxin module
MVLDQIRVLDTSRLVKRLGQIDQATADEVQARLSEMFAP